MKLKFCFVLLCLQFVISGAFARGKYDNTDTITVSRDGLSDFRTINDAVEACRAFMEYHKVIFVKNGVYHEKVIVPSWLTNIEICGEDRDSTVVTFDDHANIASWDSGRKMGTFRTFTMKVQGDYITLKNITIENNAPKLGQAVALHTEGNHLLFLNCNILGNQDTVYTGTPGTYCFFDGCRIEGTTDFIFGPSVAWFENCEIKSRSNSFITAASTPKLQKYGYIFNHCRLTAYDGVDKVYLGRPWRAYAYTLFMNCEMGSHIVKEGWKNWIDYHDPAKEGIVRYYEYNNTGSGADRSGRVEWSHELTKKEAAVITLKNVFNGDIDWIKRD